MNNDELIATYLAMGDHGKYLIMRAAWARLKHWLAAGEIEDGDLVLDGMADLERDLIGPVTHPIRTVELPPLEQT